MIYGIAFFNSFVKYTAFCKWEGGKPNITLVLEWDGSVDCRLFVYGQLCSSRLSILKEVAVL